MWSWGISCKDNISTVYDAHNWVTRTLSGLKSAWMIWQRCICSTMSIRWMVRIATNHSSSFSPRRLLELTKSYHTANVASQPHVQPAWGPVPQMFGTHWQPGFWEKKCTNLSLNFLKKLSQWQYPQTPPYRWEVGLLISISAWPVNAVSESWRPPSMSRYKWHSGCTPACHSKISWRETQTKIEAPPCPLT